LKITQDIFKRFEDFVQIRSSDQFEEHALMLFRYQAERVDLYSAFVNFLGIDPKKISSSKQIPFLPIEFFKTHKLLAQGQQASLVFRSSGTGNMDRSSHYIANPNMYRNSFTKAFELIYGPPKDWIILAYLPSYQEQGQSSLVYMVDELIRLSNDRNSKFYSDRHLLARALKELDSSGKKILLIGVSFALLELAEKERFQLKNTTVMETGGMKGRRKELIREELHEILCESFGVDQIHSEYGMTELQSQAYAPSDGQFITPPWMKVLIRDVYDPFHFVEEGVTGALNIIDLANIQSCAFIATSDLGSLVEDRFSVLGRLDHADIRGCNLLFNQEL
jgi:hypothetical protein